MIGSICFVHGSGQRAEWLCFALLEVSGLRVT